MKIQRKILSLLLAFCLVAGLLPTTSAFATGTTDTGKAIQLAGNATAANISGGQTDSVYFGTYQQSNAGSTRPNTGTEGVDWIKSDTATGNSQGPYYYIEPVKWRVLANADGQMLLLSDQNLDVFYYHTEREYVTWETSTMRSWLNGYDATYNIGGTDGIDYSSDNFIDTAFSSKEKGAIANTTVVNDNNPDYNTAGGNNTVDKIFLLSIAEAGNSSYFADNSSRKATNTAYVAGGGKIGSGMFAAGLPDAWWLRSPGWPANKAGRVNVGGSVSSIGSFVDNSDGVRPAFNVNLSSLLFISAADNSGHNSSFSAPASYSGNEWKLTLKDSNDFSTNASVTGSTSLTVGYSATTLTIAHASLSSFTSSEYTNVTAVLADSDGEVVYYGSINSNISATSSMVTIPAGLAVGSYTLSIYGEDWNGAKLTDYATGTPITTTITVKATPIVTAPTANTLTYTGLEQELVTAGSTTGGTLYYSLTGQDSDWSTEIPTGTNAGSYIVYYKVVGDDKYNDYTPANNSVSVTISKASSNIDTVPAAKEITYTGSAQELVTVGEASGGTLCYSLTGQDSDWSTEIPTGINAGTYIVYYKVVGDDNHNDYTPESNSVSVTIDKAALTASYFTVMQDDGGTTVTLTTSEKKDITFTQSKIEPAVTVAAGSPVTASDYTVTYGDNTAVGSGTVTITGRGNFTGTLIYTFNIVDTEAPAGTLAIETNSWDRFWNTVAFGLFFKDTQTVSVTVSDNDGVATTEYYLAGAEAADVDELSGVTWTTFSNSFAINPDNKYVVYVRITDNSGNSTIINSGGVVLYTDSEANTTDISFTRTGTADVTADVTLHGNTVSGITCTDSSQNTETLSAGDYSVDSNGTITFNNSWLSTLAAGAYTLTVSYNPQGEAYVEAAGNDAPATTAVTLAVSRAAGSVTVTNAGSLSKTYDGTAVTAPAYDTLSTGTVTVEYKVQGADDSAYTSDAPEDAGSYTVRVTVAADDDYTAASATTDFTIAKATYDMSGVSFADTTYEYDGNEKTLEISGKLPDGVTVTYSDNTLTETGNITVTASFTGDEDNYEVIEPLTATLTVAVLTELPEQEFPDDLDHAVIIKVGLDEVPDGLKDMEDLDTVEEITSALTSVLIGQSGYPEGNTIIYDVTMMVSEDNGETWMKATEDHFPAGGITVILPYPEETNKDDYDFSATHMFTVTSKTLGTTAGKTEQPEVTKLEDGIQVTLTGLSPVGVAWKEISTGGTVDSGSDTETAATTGTAGNSGSTDAVGSTPTGDEASILLWIVLMILAATGIAVIVIGGRKRNCNR